MQHIDVEYWRIGLPIGATQRPVPERQGKLALPALNDLVLIKLEGQRHRTADSWQTESVVVELVVNGLSVTSRHLKGTTPGDHFRQCTLLVSDALELGIIQQLQNSMAERSAVDQRS
ncbi:hypothetical protein D3C87_1447190 [compost metagenome]